MLVEETCLGLSGSRLGGGGAKEAGNGLYIAGEHPMPTLNFAEGVCTCWERSWVGSGLLGSCKTEEIFIGGSTVDL